MKLALAIVITFFLGFICILGLSIKESKQRKIFFIGAALSITVLYILGICSAIDKEQIIPAIEVYRGNTTLQITYQDSIPIDSVVVYKNK